MAICFKIVDYKDGTIKTLFHGLNGSRVLAPGEWLRAERKYVTDGSNSTKYLSGWHVLRTRKEAEKYMKNFTNIKDKLIIPCRTINVRKKEHSRQDVYLADYIWVI